MVSLSLLGVGYKKVRNFLYYLGAIMLIGIVLLTIINSVIYGFTNDEWRPLWDNTAGQVLASETYIKSSMIVLNDIKEKNLEIPFDYAGSLKKTIFNSLLIIGVFWFLVASLLYKLFTWNESEASMTSRKRFWKITLAIILMLLVWGGIEYYYNCRHLDLDWQESFPFQGFWSIYKYRSAFGEFGSVKDKIFSVGLESYNNASASSENVTESILDTATMLNTF